MWNAEKCYEMAVATKEAEIEAEKKEVENLITKAALDGCFCYCLEVSEEIIPWLQELGFKVDKTSNYRVSNISWENNVDEGENNEG